MSANENAESGGRACAGLRDEALEAAWYGCLDGRGLVAVVMAGNGDGLTRIGAEVVVEAALAACWRRAVDVEVGGLVSGSGGSFEACR